MMNFRVAVVGAGPAGYYAAEHLLASTCPIVSVDMFERLPTPWGLVRAGVAPDHPKIKSVSAQFVEIAAHPRYRFFGNVELGLNISRSDLLRRYDAVIYATGAQSERRLGIPDEELAGSLAARDFVGWYNGHPDHASLAPDLSGTRAIVVGNGNVALDVARMLLLPQDCLSRTDIADHALSALTGSRIREITILGRRGPAQAAFTTPELREIVGIEDLNVEVDDSQLALPESLETADMKRAQRNLSVLGKLRASSRACGRTLRFRFLRSPLEILGVGRVEELVTSINRLERHGELETVVDSGGREVFRADLIIRAIGYRGVALPGVPFDERLGIIPNYRGAVLGGVREYAVGWIKRGATGIVGTNRGDAVETTVQLLGDLSGKASMALPPDEIINWLRSSCPDLVDQCGWMEIDRCETVKGHESGRPRVKLVTIDALLAAACGRITPNFTRDQLHSAPA